MDIVAADIGGTRARFAIARIEGGRVVSLDSETTLNTADHPSFDAAWREFAAGLGSPLPRAASIATAGPVAGDAFKFTNNAWSLQVSEFKRQAGLDRLLLINDFAAIAHAVAHLEEDHFKPLCGPPAPLPRAGVVSVIGPGTGLGVAQLIRAAEGDRVVSTEGGHMNFAPSDEFEDALLVRLRARHAHVSAERIVSGPGLRLIYERLAEIEGRSAAPVADDKALWAAALEGGDPFAATALQRFCSCFGSCAGDIALAQGAAAVVIAGGLAQRMARALAHSNFHERFLAKGRFASMMAAMPIKLLAHPQPGLFGAAAAFAREGG